MISGVECGSGKKRPETKSTVRYRYAPREPHVNPNPISGPGFKVRRKKTIFTDIFTDMLSYANATLTTTKIEKKAKLQIYEICNTTIMRPTKMESFEWQLPVKVDIQKIIISLILHG